MLSLTMVRRRPEQRKNPYKAPDPRGGKRKGVWGVCHANSVAPTAKIPCLPKTRPASAASASSAQITRPATPPRAASSAEIVQPVTPPVAASSAQVARASGLSCNQVQHDKPPKAAPSDDQWWKFMCARASRAAQGDLRFVFAESSNVPTSYPTRDNLDMTLSRHELTMLDMFGYPHIRLTSKERLFYCLTRHHVRMYSTSVRDAQP